MAKSSDIVNSELKEYIKLITNYYNVFAVILFGSYAEEKAGEYSDIDVAVFSDDFGKDSFKDMKKLFKLRRQIDTDIEPIPFRKQDYFEHDEADFLNEIISRGKIIYKEGRIFI